MSIRRRVEDLEQKPCPPPTNEEGARFWLAAQALRREDRNLFRAYLHLIDQYPDQDRLAVADKGTPAERQAHQRLKDLEQLPLEKLERREAS